MRKDFEKIEVREGATVLEAIFNNLLEIISRTVAFVSSISGLSRPVRLDSSYNMKMVRNSRNFVNGKRISVWNVPIGKTGLRF